MNKILPPEMLEAARLTKAGQLKEATAVLQKLLTRLPGPAAENGDAPGLLSRAGDWLKEHLPGEPPPATQNAHSQAGQFLAKSFSNQAGSRPYKLYVPSGYHGQKVPLIVMLHGCTQSPDDFAAGTRMNEAAEEQSASSPIRGRPAQPTCRSAGTGSARPISSAIAASPR